MDDVDKTAVTLKIPIGAMEAYSQAIGWRDFFFLEEVDFSTTGIGGVVATPQSALPGYYSTDGRKLQQPGRGVNIVRYPDGRTKKILVK